MNPRDSKGVHVYSEDEGITFELLAKGRELADKLGVKLTLLRLGLGEQGVDEAIAYGADEIYVVEDAALASFDVEAYTEVLTHLAHQYRPDILLIGATKRGKELAPRVAARLETGCITDCMSFDLDAEKRLFQMGRLAYSGKAVEVKIILTKPQIATVPQGLFEKRRLEGRRGEVTRVQVPVKRSGIEMLEAKRKVASGAKLEEATFIVSGGRGLNSREDFKIMEDLAKEIGGRLACSRPVAAERGWFTEWVGLSGHKVRPDLYVACGISGAIQHLAGIRDARIVVAINTDPNSPIFANADYGIVGDLYEVVPALTEALKKRRSKG